MAPLSNSVGTITRSDSVRGAGRAGDRRSVHFTSAPVEQRDLQSFERSATGHLRTLSKLAGNGDVEGELGIKTADQEVAGLHGRRRLQRGASQRAKPNTVGYAGRTWMDTQRQYLQAYEYLCHIGEAKEWIEDIIHHSIPPIVQLEEALRDGVTLAEVVQALNPGRTFRIFRHQKLQFRHSDNIAIFFNFLAQMELPDLFRFELVDLYEKKNIPKVIYCIHALSWLLFRRGIVDFRIGNLVGQLQFEDHELEAMQKGLDRSGISMPNFGQMKAAMGAEPEPEPEPVETEDERIDREMHENIDVIDELRAQIRGALVRLRLGETMQNLWESEDWIVELQSRLRGEFARQITDYKIEMRRFAVQLQSAARGFIVRSREQDKETFWQENAKDVVVLQSLVRARKARAQTQNIRSHIRRQENGVRNFQAAIRGALKRNAVGDQYYAVQEAQPQVQLLQAAIRATFARKQVDRQFSQVQAEESKIELLQSAIRGMTQRRYLQADRTSLRQHEQQVQSLQSTIRAMLARRRIAKTREELQLVSHEWISFQSRARGHMSRRSVNSIREALRQETNCVVSTQAAVRGLIVRLNISDLLEAFERSEESIVMLQSLCRAYLWKRSHKSDQLTLKKAQPSILELQSAVRGYLYRQHMYELLCDLHDHADSIVSLQSYSRAVLLRNDVETLLASLQEHEEAVVEFQTRIRGAAVRKRFAEKQKFYRENMQKVIKIQSFVRGRQQGEAYKTLTEGKNPPVSTIKNFVHLLNDSDFDFDEEIGKFSYPFEQKYII